MVVVGFQPWTGWWFSWNDIVILYILRISLKWKQNRVLYIIFYTRFKSVIQHYICGFPPTPTPTTPLPHWKSASYFIWNQDKVFFVIVLIVFLQYKMTLRIYPNYKLDLSKNFSLKLLWQGGSKKMGVLILWLLCMCDFIFLFFTQNTCIKVSNYLLWLSFYLCKSINLI